MLGKGCHLVCSYLVHDKGASPEQLDDLSKFLQLVRTVFLASIYRFYVKLAKYTIHIHIVLLFTIFLLLFLLDQVRKWLL